MSDQEPKPTFIQAIQAVIRPCHCQECLMQMTRKLWGRFMRPQLKKKIDQMLAGAKLSSQQISDQTDEWIRSQVAKAQCN